jgi:hypothetical protein
MQTIPTNNIIYTEFFNQVRASIAAGTFAKLTLAKTVGKPELQNIYVKTIVEDNVLKLSLTYKIYTTEKQELVKICALEDLESELIPHINNPFLSALLFTTEADITMKLNKKRVASIIEQAPTFKNADVNLADFLASN